MSSEVILKIASEPLVGTVLGLLGLLTGFYFYLKTRRVARMAYETEEFAAIGGKNAAFPEEVTIQYAGNRVKRLTVSRVAVWNAGNTTLLGSDIVAGDKLRVDTGSDIILRVDTLRTTRDVNKVDISKYLHQNQAAEINFDYLDPGDGFMAEIIHTGLPGDLRVLGTIRGLSKQPMKRSSGRPKLFYSEAPVSLKREAAIIFFTSLILFIAAFLVPSMFSILDLWFGNNTAGPPNSAKGAISSDILGLSLLTLAMGICLYYLAIRGAPSALQGRLNDQRSSWYKDNTS